MCSYIEYDQYWGNLVTCNLSYVIFITFEANSNITIAKQKHLGCKKVRGQSEATCKQAGATKSFDISGGQEVSHFIKILLANSLNDMQ